MWAITNQTRFKAERAFARDAGGAEIWIVAVRATFAIGAEGAVKLADEQADVCLSPKHRGEPGRSSLLYDMDLVRTKPGTDLLVHSAAYAEEGRASKFVDVSLRVGRVFKQLRVFGRRVWLVGPVGFTPSEPEPFVSHPITYETALGGPLTGIESPPRDPENPVGIGRIAEASQPVSRVEYPADPVRSPEHKGPPAGFGPIPCDWQSRVKLAGTYDEAWQRDRQPLVPKDFQDAYFRCAPADQQVNGFLQGGEEVILRNLTPDGLLRFHLPRVSLGFRTRIDGGTTHHHGHIHTITIEPEKQRLIMVWQTSLPCHHTLYTLKETVVFEKERLPLGGDPHEKVGPAFA